MNNQLILNKILEAKENRARIRNDFAENGEETISLTFNIAGYPKHNDLIDKCFNIAKDDLLVFLSAHRILLLNNFYDKIDEAGRILIIPLNEKNLSLVQIKNLTEKFENQHFLQRIIDVDIFDNQGEPISSGKQKKCLICNKPANICRQEQNHSYDELRLFTFNKMQNFYSNFIKNRITKSISISAKKAILFEVSLTPKPGLVDFNNSGSHNDMSFNTFLASSAAISEYWIDFANLAFNESIEPSTVLPKIRQIGLEAERDMFFQTKNVNTQKGLIFLLGISAYATTFVLKNNNEFNQDKIVEVIQQVSANIIDNELIKNKNIFLSNGEKLFEKFGLKAAGARYQVQKGLPLVFYLVLPFLKENLTENYLVNKSETDKVLLTSLLKIIANLDDTNVLHRNGLIIAEKLKKMAKRVTDGNLSYNQIAEFCRTENISSGGAADLLAVSLFFYFIEQDFKKL